MNDTPTSSSKLAYSPEEFAAASGIGRTKVFDFIRRGELKAKKADRRTIITRSDGEEFLKALPNRDPEAA